MSDKLLKLVSVLRVCLVLAACACGVPGQDCAEPYANSKQSVVSIWFQKVEKETGRVTKGNGTGFVITDEGYVVTAYHVIEADPNTDKVILKGVIGSLSGTQKDLEIITGDKTKGIALLRFKDTGQPYDPIAIGDPFKVRETNPLCSLSFSEHLDLGYHPSLGFLTARNATDPQAGVTNLWVTDMKSNHGESGAPVFDVTRGGVVGIKHGGRDPATAQGVNYVIPLNLGRSMLGDYCDIQIPPVAGSRTSESGLKSLKVNFRAVGADNDFTTIVGINVTRGGVKLISSVFEGLKFATNDVYGPYNMSLGQVPINKATYKDSLVTLIFRPNGHDTWITAMSLEATFHDGEVIRSESGTIVVNQESRTITFKPEHLVSAIPKPDSSAVVLRSLDPVNKP